MEKKPTIGWYNRNFWWQYGHPRAATVFWTALTLFFAWFVIDDPEKSDHHRFGALLYACFSGLAAIGSFKVAQRRWLRNKAVRTHWPVVDGYIAQMEDKYVNDRFRVTLAYTYVVEGERYVGRESFAFVRDEDVANFENGFRERTVKVRYRPDKPSVSVLDREDMPT